MIFVTGATGILGRVIVLELLKQGKTVRAAKRPTSNLKEVKESFRFYTEKSDFYFDKIEWINVDFQDIHSLEKALQGIEEVYHCSVKVSFHPKDKKEMFQTNIEGTKNLLYVCGNSSIKKFCFVSSIAVLDGLNEFGEMDENSDFNSKLDHSDYTISKHFSEMEVWRASAEGLNAVIINPGVIIGSGNWEQSSGVLFSVAETNRVTFSGGTSYVDVRDVANIAIQLMNKNIFGERFILISENLKYFDFIGLIREKLKLSKPKVFSKSFLKLVKILNFLLGWLISKLRVANKVNIKSVSIFTPISNEKIRKYLDYTFIPISESIDFHLKNYLDDKKN